MKTKIIEKDSGRVPQVSQYFSATLRTSFPFSISFKLNAKRRRSFNLSLADRLFTFCVFFVWPRINLVFDTGNLARELIDVG
jgi:hypothetical protein